VKVTGIEIASQVQVMTPIEQIADLADVPLDVQVELGRHVMTIAQILERGSESVIRMDRSAEDDIDILVGVTMIGYGEIVIIEDSVGLRITHFRQEK
jgi:flagellar motor switch protein FliN/FliY